MEITEFLDTGHHKCGYCHCLLYGHCLKGYSLSNGYEYCRLLTILKKMDYGGTKTYKGYY